MPVIQFLSFDGCPHADAARTALRRALEICGLPTDWYETVDVLDDSTPAHLANWGSPTILVNGVDVAGLENGDGAVRRVYETPDNVPSVHEITLAILRAITT